MRTRGMPSFGFLSDKEKDRTYVLGPEGFIFTSPYVLTPSTARNSVTILLALDSPPFLIGQKEGMTKTRGVLVGSLVTRALAAVDVKLVSINIFPYHPSFRVLNDAANDGIIHLPRQVLSRFDTDLESLYAGRLAPAAIRRLFNAITAGIVAHVGAPSGANPLRSEILDLIRAHPEISLKELAAEIGIHYATTSRLFSDTMGTPLRSFQHARRLQVCWQGIGLGRPLTQIAHDAGFADSAHLTRAWRRAYGMAPSYIAKSRSCEVNYV